MENNGKESRRHLSSEKKFEIVKEVIIGKSPVSLVCKKHEVATGQYYKWQQLFFNGAIEGLRHKKNGRRRIGTLPIFILTCHLRMEYCLPHAEDCKSIRCKLSAPHNTARE